MTRGPIRSARGLSLTGAVASDTRFPPTLVGTTRDHERPTAFAALQGHAGTSCRKIVQVGSRFPFEAELADRAAVFMSDEKSALRTAALEARKAAFDRYGPDACRKLASFGLDFAGVRQGAIVSGFSAIRDEINPSHLMLWLHAEGHPLALPVMVGRERPLVMREWTPGDAMLPAAWGIAEPLDDKPEVDPDVVLVPLLAFDRHGARLGYGGGFYDRTLERLRAIKPVIAVGVAYDEQEVSSVPTESYDQRLDWVLTPSGPQRCQE